MLTLKYQIIVVVLIGVFLHSCSHAHIQYTCTLNHMLALPIHFMPVSYTFNYANLILESRDFRK